jgi:hypothetical protein
VYRGTVHPPDDISDDILAAVDARHHAFVALRTFANAEADK